MSDPNTHNVAFVRDAMLPEREPPLTETGVVKWVRENLFASWMDILLTVVSIFLLWSILSHFLPWALRGIWDAGSLTECREIRSALYSEGTEVACWAVIADRWQQLVFGFYPAELYWRPVLAFVVLGFALMPILFANVPRKMILVSVAAPFVIFWLVWGGTLWGPLAVAAGFVIGAFVYLYVEKVSSTFLATLAAVVVPVLYWYFVCGPLVEGLSSIVPLAITKVVSNDIGGFMLAIIIGVSGIVLSLPLGILLALGRQSDLFIINKSSVAFIEVIRGVPLIVWLFTASLLLNYFLPPGTNFDLMLRVIIMVTLFSSAYIAEVVRGGLAALPKGQYEAADAMGLDYWKSMRLVILPQALKISIPGIVNTFIGLFKDTTLVVFIGLLDPIGFINAIRSATEWNGVYWEPFIFVGLMFFVFCFSMGRYSLYLEKKLRREHR